MSPPRPPGAWFEGHRRYVALTCHCGAKDCPGWAKVHDDPTDKDAFRKLFPAPEAKR